MLSELKEELNNFPQDDLIYLIRKLSSKAGFFVTNNHLLYMVKNSDYEKSKSIDTEYLSLNTNVKIKAFADNQLFESGKYNVLKFIPTATGYVNSDLETFVNLCSAHAIYMNANNFVKFFYSLINIFQYPVEQSYKNLVGLFGELSVIKYIYERIGLDISVNWHRNGESSCYDFVLKNLNLEVKSSTSTDNEIQIKHSQLFNNDNNYLVVVKLENNDSGETINDLIDKLLYSPDYCNNYNFAVNIEKERKRVSLVEAENVLLSVKDIFFFCANDINPFPTIPDEVESLSYKIYLSKSDQIDISSVMENYDV